MQKDIFMDVLSVREIFKFVVDMRNFDDSDSKKKNKIDDMIKILKLRRAENNIVGNADYQIICHFCFEIVALDCR